MKVAELRGFKSLRAYNAFSTLILGLKMLPMYIAESYEEFLMRVQKMADDDKKRVIREAAMLVPLEQEEVDALLCFCTDSNNVPFSKENMKNLSADQIIEAIVAVCFEMSKIKVDFVTESEKKN